MTVALRSATDYQRVLAVLLVASSITPAVFAVKWMITTETLFPDFFGLWSFGRYVLTHAPATIYNDPLLQGFQAGLGMPADNRYSFFYPPWTLLILAPLGALPYAAARAIWLLLTFAAYVTALTAWRWQRVLIGLLLLAPSSAVCFLVGQSGFLTAALMLGGHRLLPTQPLVAGAMLASVACKPQLAVLVPFVLLFGRHGRAMVGAGLATALLSVATTLAFGTGIWGAWLAFMRDNGAALTDGRGTLLDMMPTVTSAVLLLGGGGLAASTAQTAAALAAVYALWRVRARSDPNARAVLPLATILATPYAFHYDLPMVTGSLLSAIAARIKAGETFERVEFPLLLACIMVPALLPARLGPVAAAVPVIFALELWRVCRHPSAS